MERVTSGGVLVLSAERLASEPAKRWSRDTFPLLRFQLHPKPSHQFLKLIERAVMENHSAPPLLDAGADLDAQAELAGEGFFQILEMSGGAALSL